MPSRPPVTAPDTTGPPDRGAGSAAGPKQGGKVPISSPLSETVYAHLRAIAQKKLSEEKPGHTLQATALVHEAFMRLERGGGGHPNPQAGPGFYWAAAQAMRRILIEHARAKHAVKRGGGQAQRVDWSKAVAGAADLAAVPDSDEFEALDRAILRLGEHDARAADVVRLRFFVGLNLDEVARTLEISQRSAKRDWEYARAWLLRELGGPKSQ
jgi:RNA polymerase sigma factor (TIGR02999 family)